MTTSARASGKKYTICTAYRDDSEYIVKSDGGMPEGFCGWAWRDVYKNVSVLAFGGDFPWMEKSVAITCCTDGVRPVSFHMERLNE